MEAKKIIDTIKHSFNHYKTEDLTFRVMTRSDIYALYTATQNEEFNKNLLWKVPTTESQMIIEAEKLLRESNLNWLAPISICEKQTGTWLGIIKFAPLKKDMEMVLWTLPSYFKKESIFKSFLSSTLSIIFTDTSINKIYYKTRLDNTPARSMLEKAHFNFLEEVFHENKNNIDFAQYVITREVFEDLAV